MEGLETNNGNQISCLFFLVVNNTLNMYITRYTSPSFKVVFCSFLNLLLDFQLLELWDFLFCFPHYQRVSKLEVNTLMMTLRFRKRIQYLISTYYTQQPILEDFGVSMRCPLPIPNSSAANVRIPVTVSKVCHSIVGVKVSEYKVPLGGITQFT